MIAHELLAAAVAVLTVAVAGIVAHRSFRIRRRRNRRSTHYRIVGD
jgi:hypothetical protein